MPLKSAIHLRLKEAGEFLHNKVKFVKYCSHAVTYIVLPSAHPHKITESHFDNQFINPTPNF